MKKIFYSFIAVAAMALASCGGQTNAEANVEDSTAIDPACAIETLNAAIETGDADVIASAMAEAEGIIAQLTADGQTEEAAAYSSKIQECVATNIEKLEAVATANATISDIVTRVMNAPANVEAAAEGAVEAAKADGEAIVDNAKAAAEGVKDAAEAKATEAVNAAANAAAEKANAAAEKANAAANKAVDDAAAAAKKKLGL